MSHAICRQLPATFLVLPALRLKSFLRNERPPSSEPISHGQDTCLWAYKPKDRTRRASSLTRQPTLTPGANKIKNQCKHWTTSYAKLLIPSLRFPDVSNESRHGPFLILISLLIIADDCGNHHHFLVLSNFSDRSKRTRTLEAFRSFGAKLHYRRQPKPLHRGQRLVRAHQCNTHMSRILFDWMPHRGRPWHIMRCKHSLNSFICKTLAFELLVYTVISIVMYSL